MSDNGLQITCWKILGSLQACQFVDANNCPVIKLLIIDVSYSASNHATMMFKITNNSDNVDFCLTNTKLSTDDIYNIDRHNFTSKRTNLPRIGLPGFVFTTNCTYIAPRDLNGIDPLTVTREDINRIFVAMCNGQLEFKNTKSHDREIDLPTTPQVEIIPDYFNFHEYKWKAHIVGPKGFCIFSSRLIEHNSDNNWYYIVSAGQYVETEKYAVSVTRVADTYEAEIDSIPFAFSSHSSFQFKTWDELIRKLSETIVAKFML